MLHISSRATVERGAVMTDKNRDPKQKDPALDDVETGSDADATPVAEPGKTPPNPNKKPDK
jgi:hypothetical protein